MLIKALVVALSSPDARVVIICRVRKQARGIYWQLLQRLCRDFELGAHFRRLELECELPNGSLIQFSGADTAEEIEKLRGLSFNLAVIDECKSYPDELLVELIDDVLQATTLDQVAGQIVMIGTPGPVIGGMFWAITTAQPCYPLREGEEEARPLVVRRWGTDGPEDFEWSLHGWSQRDNVKAPQVWQNALKVKAKRRYTDDNPTWLREFLGIWAADLDALIFSYARITDDRCLWVRDETEGAKFGLPAGHDWRFMLGIDLGWHDDSAFVVAAWAETFGKLVYVHTEKHPHLNIEEIADKCRELEQLFGFFDVRIVDTGGLGKTILESLSAVYGIPCEAARKTDKHDHIKLLNADMEEGKIWVDPKSPLAQEWRLAQWEDASRKRVDPNCADHASDAAMYLWRYAHHHFFRRVVAGPEKGTEQWWQEQERREEEAFRDQLKFERETPRWKQMATHLDKGTKERWKTRSILKRFLTSSR